MRRQRSMASTLVLAGDPGGQLRRALRQAWRDARELCTREAARRRAEHLTGERVDLVRAYRRAGQRQLIAARMLRWSNQMPAALAAYGEASKLLACAFVALRRADVDVACMSADALSAHLDEGLADASTFLHGPAERAAFRAALHTSDPLAAHRLGILEAESRAGQLDAFARQMQSQTETCSPRELRWLRLLQACLVAALVAWSLTSAVLPFNVARGKLATSSSAALDTEPWGAVDGDVSRPFGFHSQDEESPWLAVDLGRRAILSRARVSGRGDCCFDQSIPLAIEVSDDGVTYREMARRTSPFSQKEPWVVALPRVAARFVRLRTLRHSVLVVSELEVYGR
jgi:hypothetical protein